VVGAVVVGAVVVGAVVVGAVVVGAVVAGAAGWVTGVNALAVGVGFFAGCLAGVFEALTVAVGVAGGFVVSPARDAVGLGLGPPCEPVRSRTATTAMMTAAAAAVSGQRHRRQPDGGWPGGTGGMPLVPPATPGTVRAALCGPDAGTMAVAGSSGPRARSSRVAAIESAAAAAASPAATAGTAGPSAVAS